MKYQWDNDRTNYSALKSTDTYLEVQISILKNHEVTDNCSDIHEYTVLANNLLKQGIECQESEQLILAVMNLQESLALFHACGDLKRQALALSYLALVANYAQDYKSVIAYSQQCLSIIESNPDLKFQLLTNLGDSYHYLGDINTAIIFLRQSLKIVKKQQDKLNQVAVLNNLGLLYKALGRMRRAIILKRASLAIAREIKEEQLEVKILKNLANTWYEFGDYQAAILHYEDWMTISHRFNHPSHVIDVLGNLGESYYVLGNYPKAVKYYEKRLELAGMLKHAEIEEQTLVSLKVTTAALGDEKKAKMYEEMIAEVVKS